MLTWMPFARFCSNCLLGLVAFYSGAIAYAPNREPSLDGSHLVPITAANAARLQQVGQFNPPDADFPVTNMVWSPDNRTLYSGGKDTAHITAWDVATGSVKFTLDTDYSAFALSSDGALIAVDSSGDLGGVTIYDTHTLAVMAFMHCSGGSQEIAFSPANNKLLVVNTEGGNTTAPLLDFWLIKPHMQIDTTYAEPCAPDHRVSAIGGVPYILFNPDGQSLLYGTHLLKLSNFNQFSPFSDIPDYGIVAVAFSPDGKRLAAHLAESQSILIWHSPSAGPIQLLATLDLTKDLSIAEVTVTRLAVSPNGQLLALLSYGMVKGVATDFVWLWDAEKYQPVSLLAEPDNGGLEGSIAFSPDGKRLAVAGSIIQVYGLSK